MTGLSLPRFREVFVVSDLHLAPVTNNPIPSMFNSGPALAEKIDEWTRCAEAWRDRERDDVEFDYSVGLILNGDVFDTLATPDQTMNGFAADVSKGGKAQVLRTAREMETWIGWLFDDHAGIFDALKAFVEVPGTLLIWCIGNHDVELVYPNVQERLRRRIGRRIVFSTSTAGYAFEIVGEVVEADRPRRVWAIHGNVQDPDNSFRDEYLASVAAIAAGGHEGRALVHEPPNPGSFLVVTAINRIKRLHRFIDLLKPEAQLLFPVLLWWVSREQRYWLDGKRFDPLDGELWSALERSLKRFSIMRSGIGAEAAVRERAGTTRQRLLGSASGPAQADPREPGGGSSGPWAPLAAPNRGDAWRRLERVRKVLPEGDGLLGVRGALAHHLFWFYFDETSVGGDYGEGLRRWALQLDTGRGNGVEKLANCLLEVLDDSPAKLSLCWKEDELDAIVSHLLKHEALASEVDVVVAGHTHLAREREVRRRGGDPLIYLNTGTWADLMRCDLAQVGGSVMVTTHGNRGPREMTLEAWLSELLTEPGGGTPHPLVEQRLTYAHLTFGSGGFEARILDATKSGSP